MVQRFPAPRARRLDEDFKIRARLRLAHEVREPLRAQRRILVLVRFSGVIRRVLMGSLCGGRQGVVPVSKLSAPVPAGRGG